MKETLVAIALLAMTGCMPKSHRLLGEGEDGGGAASSSPATWSDCAEGVRMGRHMDFCTEPEGGECGVDWTYGHGYAGTCIGGRLFSVEATRLHGGEGCTDPFVFQSYRFQIVTAVDGCADLWICQDSMEQRASVCQRDPLPAVRPDAVGMTPWTDCEAALQSGMDGDPCEGELACVGSRGGFSNPLLVYCDAGIVRMSPMMGVIHSLD